MVDLPAPDGPDDGAARSRRDVEVEAFEDLAPVFVTEAHVVEAHCAARDVRAPARRRGPRPRPGIEQVPHRLHVDQALADRAIDPAEHVERAEQLHQQRVDEHHVARREAALGSSPRR